MQVGDKVQLLGTVRDIVDKSVLLVTPDHMNQREYWVLEEHLVVVESAPPAPPPVAEQLPAEEPEKEPPARPAHQPAQPVRPAPTPVRR